MATTPTASTITKRGRYYVDTRDGGRYPSVTTVIDAALDKPGLRRWYANSAADRAVNQLAELSRRVRLDGPEEAAKWVAAAPRDTARNAALKGSDLHDLADRHAQGEPFPDHLDDDVRAMVGQYERFLVDFQPAIVRSEMTVLNRRLGYGGTCDAVMSIPDLGGVPVVCDYKTGRTGPYAEWAVQLAAYANGECVLTKQTRGHREEPMPAVDLDRALILRVRPDTYELHEADLSGLLDVFAAMLRIFAFTESTPFTRRYAAHESAGYWLDLIAAATTVDDLTAVWVDATAAGSWDDTLLAACRTRKQQITRGAA